jgi:hypothetical protein
MTCKQNNFISFSLKGNDDKPGAENDLYTQSRFKSDRIVD